ncbi:hypothetical protein AVEN_56960-1 [Araneus ventricosus]|uniref:Uncharacterized protein n=1 Tax=Araneus ventricosus TaxID=182803 RepID=A0A4Y2JWM1_ARAVE|nr:hypothetical protein AVEN_56960-1 [Araneus ventricosus]
MPFAVPMAWRKPSNYFRDCYFCITNTEGYLKKKNQKIDYPNIPSTLRPAPHGEGLPRPTPSLSWKDIIILQMSDIEDPFDGNIDIAGNISDPTFRPETSSQPYFIH